ncbi:hypothetical protein [Nocardioides sp. B-3]|uniref:hypothetical protein n=1 Tax=Nocardioides sp. B-3 TaxID=2895565 RepID=UPI002342BD86|nr:hypothetical protein [Nocardioides sp. B-3]
MIDIKSMGYVRVASTDLDAWRSFAEKVLGLAAGRGPSPDNLYYRIDEVSARLVVFPERRRRAVGDRVGAGRPRRAPAGTRAPAEGRSRLRRGHRRRAGRATGAGADPFPRPVRQRLRALPRHHLRITARGHAVRRKVRHRRPGHGPHRGPGQRRRRGAAVLPRRARLPAAGLDVDAG